MLIFFAVLPIAKYGGKVPCVFFDYAAGQAAGWFEEEKKCFR